MPEPRRGEVWLVDLGYTGKTRPAIILSRDDPDAPRALVIYVPVTTKNRGSKYEVDLPGVAFLTAGSLANVQGVASQDKNRFHKKIGELPNDALANVEQALKFALDL